MPKLARSPVPLYFQLSTRLEEQIVSGSLPVGAQLPNEKQLACDYGVSLITVRAAMRVLIDKQIVVRHRGKGTFVAARTPPSRQLAIGSIEDLETTGHNSVLQLLWRRRVPASPEVARKLGVTAAQGIVAMRTIRTAQSEPFMMTDTYQLPHIAKYLKKADFTTPAARSKLAVAIAAEKLGLGIGSIRQAMSVERAHGEIARVLGVKSGHLLLVVDRDYYADNGSLIQVARARYRTDHYSYVMNLVHTAVPAKLDRAA